MLHAKVAVVDGARCTVGSCNLDMRSRLHAEEVNAVVIGAMVASRLQSVIESDIKRSRPILFSEWRNRPIAERGLEWTVTRFKYWL